MSTCSLIGFKPATTLGTAPIQYIYCHFDGYPTGVGAVLNEHYTTPEKVKQLMELGNLSILAPEIGFKRNFDAPYGDEKAMAIHRENNKKYCLAYGRDRGEDNQGASLILKASAFFSEVDANGCDFGYLFDESTGEWDFCDYHGNSKNLKQYLTEKQGEAAQPLFFLKKCSNWKIPYILYIRQPSLKGNASHGKIIAIENHQQ